MEREWEIKTPDGCLWRISWFEDAAGFFADVWDCGEDDETHPGDPAECSCPFPTLGIYDTLDTIEVAMGIPIPNEIREELLGDASLRPIREDDKGAWGRVWAAEVHRRAPDGTIFSSFAPTWASNPYSPLWNPDDFPLLDVT